MLVDGRIFVLPVKYCYIYLLKDTHFIFPREIIYNIFLKAVTKGCLGTDLISVNGEKF
jgi:hypothetical protein